MVYARVIRLLSHLEADIDITWIVQVENISRNEIADL
jgi:hypothetical protein